MNSCESDIVSCLHRYNSFILEQRRKTIAEKLAKKERKREKKRKRLLKSGQKVPPELEVSLRHTQLWIYEN